MMQAKRALRYPAVERPTSGRPWRALLAALSLLAACAAARPQALAGGFTNHTIVVGGIERSYLLYAPHGASASNGPRALVILLHGGGGSARQIADHVGQRLSELANRDGFYIAVPNAVRGTWDFGAGIISSRLPQRVDDRAFFEALLDTLPVQLPIDRQRIFATGISRGGMASYFIGCSFPGRIRAIAPVAMPLPNHLEELCAASPPLGIAVINGTADPLVPYNGGWITLGRMQRDQVLSTSYTVDFWRSRNGCNEVRPVVERIDSADDGMQVEKSSWHGCWYAPVVLYRVDGGGHTWPSSEQNLPGRLVGRINRDIDASVEIWAFFGEFR